MRMKLKRKPQRVSLKIKNKPVDSIEQHHEILAKQIALTEEKNKKLPPIETGKWYHYKDRLPPNDFSAYILAKRCEYGGVDAIKSAVMLQHYLATLYCSDRIPQYPEWILLPK